MARTRELPGTLEDAHQMISDLHARNAALQSENAELRHQIDEYIRHRFGQRSERLDPEQYKLAFLDYEARNPSGENDAGDEADVEVKGHKRRRKGHGRARFAEDLPRERLVIEPESTACECCQTPKKKIGEEVSEQIDYQPGTVKVIETVRPKYVNDCGRV